MITSALPLDIASATPDRGAGTTAWRELAPRLAGSLRGPGGVAAARRLLEERFGGRREAPATAWPTGCPGIDGPLGGGLPAGTVVELVSPGRACGARLVHLGLLATLRAARRMMALVDAADSFDPVGLGPGGARGLLWVRARGVARAMAAADVLVRDANLPVVVLDLVGAGPGSIPAAAWYRLQRAVEAQGTALLVTTSRPCVPACRLRFELVPGLRLADLERARGGVTAALRPVFPHGGDRVFDLAS